MLALALYYGLATRLPDTGRPLGSASQRLRQLLCREFLAQAGKPINIGPGVHLGTGAEVRIGSRSGLGRGCQVYGGVTIGEEVMLGPNVSILSDNHRFDRTDLPIGHQGHTPRTPPRIEDEAWVGLGAIILPGRVIGRGAVVAAGAVVTRDVGPYTIVGGNPAVVIGSRLAEVSSGESVQAADA